MFDTIIYEQSAPVALIKFNRPEVLNAMNAQFWQELSSCLDLVAQSDDLKVVIFTGEGRAFSSGADLKESKTRSTTDYKIYISQLQEITKKILSFEKPTIAAINGYAIGSGYELALACDIRIAADEAKLGSPEAKVSSAVTGGASRLIQNLLGPGKARELLFTGELFSGKEAARIGLVNSSVPAEKLLFETKELATKISENSANSLRLIKQSLNLALTSVSMDELMDFEVKACIEAVSSEDRVKALKQFEKRK